MSDFSEFIGDAIVTSGWTSDVPLLETQDYWYVFVYGKRRGKSSAYFTHQDSEAVFISTAWTKSKIYSILNIQDGKSSHQLANTSGIDRILGELWKVPTDMLYDLDGDERNLLLTDRLQIPVVTSGGTEVKAWLYLINRKYLITGNLKIEKHTGVTYIGSERFTEIN